MTREEAIEILIAVAVCDRPILSCDFCARYAGIGTHCNYPTDEEIEESVLLLKGASNDAAISGLRQQDHFREVTKKVEPLTLDELRKIYDGEKGAVWVKIGKSCWPAILDTYDGKLVAVLSALGFLREKDYGNGWLAFCQKPEDGTV